MRPEVLPYGGWEHCVRLATDRCEIIVTTDVGPRIIRYGFIGGPNEFVEYPDQRGKTGGSDYRSYGGHRLWAAPEVKGWTNHPDNHPVEWTWAEEELILRPPVEAGTGLQKELRISLLGDASSFCIEHRITNASDNDVTLAPWALSVMTPGGTAIIPQEPFIPHTERVLPARPLVLWNYTDMTDPRFRWGKDLIMLRQDATATSPQKFGARVTAAWAAYAHEDRLFVKRFSFDESATLPDFGANVELFTNARMLEVESLGPLVHLPPGHTVTHTEHWTLVRAFVPPVTETGWKALLTEVLLHLPPP